MYAIVKTGGKQYKVCPGDKLNIEKLPAQVGDKVKLDAICVVDGDTTELDPQAAAKTAVKAVVLEQFKDKKKVVFKFKKRKNYKRLRGHRQELTRIQITAVGSEKYEAPKPKKAAAKADDAKADEKKAAAKTDEKPKAAAKKPAAKTSAAKKPAAAKEDKPAAKAADKAEKAADAKAEEE